LKRIYAYVEERRRARPDVEILATPHLQCHPLLIETFLERADEALHGAGHMNCSLCNTACRSSAMSATSASPNSRTIIMSKACTNMCMNWRRQLEEVRGREPRMRAKNGQEIFIPGVKSWWNNLDFEVTV